MSQIKFAGIDGSAPMDGSEEATLVALHVKVGQDVKVGDKVFDVEADKASNTITATVAGKVTKINFNPGDTIKSGDTIIDFGGSPETQPNSKSSAITDEKSAVEPAKPLVEPKQPAAKTSTTDNDYTNDGPILATPVARKIARDLGVDLKHVKGTGPFGRVLKTDIENAQTNGSQPSASNDNPVATTAVKAPTFAGNNVINTTEIEKYGEVVHQPLSGIRKAIANQMSLSMYTAPHVTLFIDVDATNLVNFRSVLKEDALKPENGGTKLTFMPFFVRTVAKVLSEERFQLLNSTIDLAKNEILVKKYYNIGMAADTDKGLVVPVIKNANQLTLSQTAQQVNDLAGKARKGQLKGDEMKGGTFTITNFGSAGLKYGTPIINYPEVAILGIGALEQKAVVIDNEIVIHSFFPLSLSIDHRVVDGAPAGYFLTRVKELLENPALILY